MVARAVVWVVARAAVVRAVVRVVQAASVAARAEVERTAVEKVEKVERAVN